MTQDLTARLAAIAQADALNELGCELSDSGDHRGAELCFAQALTAGHEFARFNLGNELAAQGRLREAAVELERAARDGVTEAWLNLGHALDELGDLLGARRAYEASVASGDPQAPIDLAWWHREQGEAAVAVRLMTSAVDAGSLHAAGVLASWRWDDTGDTSLEDDLRAGADHYEGARVDLALLLRDTGRFDEARAVLERGVSLGETDCLLPLGNLLDDDLHEPAAAEDAYRRHIAAGGTLSHNNLGVLLEELGRVEEAEQQYRLGTDAGDAVAARALAELLDRRNGA